MSKSSVWWRFTPEHQARYKALHDELVEKVRELIRQPDNGEYIE